MPTIKNIHKIAGLLDESAIQKLEAGAAQHKRYSNIEFKILSVSDNDIVVQVVQDKHLSGNYADQKTLAQRGKELFKTFFPDYDIHAHATVYFEPPSSVVTPEWIEKQMTEYSVKIKDLVKETGIDKTNLSAWINGLREMSQPVKAMFYYIFENKKLLSGIKPIDASHLQGRARATFISHTEGDRITLGDVDDFIKIAPGVVLRKHHGSDAKLLSRERLHPISQDKDPAKAIEDKTKSDM